LAFCLPRFSWGEKTEKFMSCSEVDEERVSERSSEDGNKFLHGNRRVVKTSWLNVLLIAFHGIYARSSLRFALFVSIIFCV
jgi:hypothetical protein